MYEAALLTRCYTQHALRPCIDAEINHQRRFIKFPFINKGMDFIDLPSIFQDRSVTSSIPDYFQNSEPPIICYKYNKPRRDLPVGVPLDLSTPTGMSCIGTYGENCKSDNVSKYRVLSVAFQPL